MPTLPNTLPAPASKAFTTLSTPRPPASPIASEAMVSATKAWSLSTATRITTSATASAA